MPKHLHSCVHRLNKVSRLYDYSIQHSRPYRIDKVRTTYQRLIEFVVAEFGITEFNSGLYNSFFGKNESLEQILIKKHEAIERKEYEAASELRDKERGIIISLLSEYGVNSSTRFFIKDERIYKL